MIFTPSDSTVVALLVLVETKVAVRATEPTSVHPSVRLGNVLLDVAAVTIACEKLIRYAAAEPGVNNVYAVPELKLAVRFAFSVEATTDELVGR
jgi:hypothetical protein